VGCLSTFSTFKRENVFNTQTFSNIGYYISKLLRELNMYNYYYYTNLRGPEVVAFAKGDVNGDRIPDNVYLTATKTPDSNRVENITVVMQDVASGVSYRIPLKDNSGYDPALFLGDFTGEGADDILISIATGGSGGIYIYYIYSFINNTARLLFDYEVFNKEYQYDVTFKDN
jgi:hypothetical protein